MRRLLTLLVALALSGGCHLVFPFEVPPASDDAGVGQDAASLDSGSGVDTSDQDKGVAQDKGAAQDKGTPDAGSSGWVLVKHGLSTNNLEGIWAGAAGSGARVWAVGDAGVILYFDGTTWSKEISGTASNLTGVWGSSTTDVWAVGANVVRRRSGGQWAWGGLAASVKLQAVWGRGPTDVWVAGEVVGRYDGSKWIVDYSTPITQAQSGWAAAAGDNWIAANNGVFRSTDDKQWTQASLTNQGSAVSGGMSGPWVVGNKGLILEWTGSGWKKHTFLTGNYHAVWVSPTSADVWLVGNPALLVHYDGVSWSKHAVPTNHNLNAIWGLPGGELWVAGNTGVILRRP